jgi:two-component system sensor histidine kinase TctE
LGISLRSSDLFLSLRFRIFALIASILTVGALILGLATHESASVAAEEAYDRLLAGATIQIAENISYQNGMVGLEPPVAAIAMLADFDQVSYKVARPDGAVVAGNADLVSPWGVQAGREGVIMANATLDTVAVRIATLARNMGDDATPYWVQIVVAQTLGARATLAESLTSKGLWLVGGMSLLFLLAGALSVRIAFEPLVRLEEEVARRKPDELQPLDLDTPQETRNLVETINDFMNRLQQRMAMMQRFIGDAAHQIRTPLASLDAQIELLDPSPALAGPQIENIRARMAELARVTEQMLNHAMVIHRSDSVHFTQIKLNDLVKDVLSRSVPLSLDREISISFTPGPEAPTVEGDAVSLREAVANLISNAIVHGAPTRLGVCVIEEGRNAIVEVMDDGPGIPDAQWSRLLKPFEKGDGHAGSGLGLAIATEVARAHGGRLDHGRTDGAFTVRLTLPRQSGAGNA